MDNRRFEDIRSIAIKELLDGDPRFAAQLYDLLHRHSQGEDAGHYLATSGLIRAFMGDVTEGAATIESSKRYAPSEEDRRELEEIADTARNMS